MTNVPANPTDYGIPVTLRLYGRDRDHLAIIMKHLELEPAGDGQLTVSSAIRWSLWHTSQMIYAHRPDRIDNP